MSRAATDHLDLPAGRLTLGGLVEWLAATYGDAPALSEQSASLSHRELEAESRALAAGLAALGVTRADRVGILMPNSIDWVVGLFAAARLGCTVVGLNTWFRRPELGTVLAHSGVTVLLLRPEFLGHDYATDLRAILGDPRYTKQLRLRMAVTRGEVAMAGGIGWDDACRKGKGHGASAVAAAAGPIGPTEPAVIVYTSGSTAGPKGAQLTHQSLVRNALAISAAVGHGSHDRVWSHFPFFFSGGLCNFLLASLIRGTRLFLQDKFEPAAALATIARGRCTVMHAWPNAIEQMLAAPEFTPESVSTVEKGTWPLDAWYGARGFDSMKGVSFYGLTETCTMVSATRWTDSQKVRSSTNGRPFVGNDVQIVGADGSPMARGEQGEILVRGFSLMLGYWQRPNPLDADGFLWTGDLGWMDDEGFLHWVGRKDNVMKVSGFLVSAEEVETALVSIEGVQAAFVTSVAAPSRDEAVVAFVVGEAGLSADAIRSECRQTLASYKAPKNIYFVGHSDIPMTGSGKVDRRALKQVAERAG